MVRPDDGNRRDGRNPLKEPTLRQEPRTMEKRENENEKGLINSILCDGMSIYGMGVCLMLV
jgi:hypothetical protein